MEYPKYDPNQSQEERNAVIQAWQAYYNGEITRRRQWVENRYKALGYKSLAHFCRQHQFGVTSGTVSNYLRGNSTMPLWFVPKLCYALMVTPNDLLAGLGYYDPTKVMVKTSE